MKTRELTILVQQFIGIHENRNKLTEMRELAYACLFDGGYTRCGEWVSQVSLEPRAGRVDE